MNKSIKSLLGAGTIISSSLMAALPAQAAEYEVTVTNLTRGIHFTPLMIAAHDSSTSAFTSGGQASASLQAMAEGGDIAGLVSDLTTAGANIVTDLAPGLLAPGMSTTTTLNTDGSPDNGWLTVLSMMLPTNDAFIGLSGGTLPTTLNDTVVFNVDAYDAGTEANDEILGSGVPGEPGFPAPGPVAATTGTGGTSVSAPVEGFIHIHRNVLGDHSLTDGISDIDATVHRWLNPVARVTVTVISE